MSSNSRVSVLGLHARSSSDVVRTTNLLSKGVLSSPFVLRYDSALYVCFLTPACWSMSNKYYNSLKTHCSSFAAVSVMSRTDWSASSSDRIMKRVSPKYKCRHIMFYASARHSPCVVASFCYLSTIVKDQYTTGQLLPSSRSCRSTHSI